jgi:hypothetical protein
LAMPKSWDIQPSVRKAVARDPQPPPTRTFADIRPIARAPGSRQSHRKVVSAPAPTKREAIRARLPSTPRVPLGRRRRSARKKVLFIVLGAIAVVLIVALILIWQPFLRITTVETEGPLAVPVRAFVVGQLTGTRFGIVPRNSIFFVPEQELRAALLEAFPQLEAVSIGPAGLNTLAVRPAARAAVLWWCGTLEAPVTPCYLADAGGFVFAEVPLEERLASSTTLSIFASLDAAPPGTTAPLGSSIAARDKLPALIQFVKAVRALGADVISVAIRGDEADLYTRAGTRITYVLGREQQAANLAASGFSTLNLNDGSLLYVDLRFDSKLFFKKK